MLAAARRVRSAPLLTAVLDQATRHAASVETASQVGPGPLVALQEHPVVAHLEINLDARVQSELIAHVSRDDDLTLRSDAVCHT